MKGGEYIEFQAPPDPTCPKCAEPLAIVMVERPGGHRCIKCNPLPVNAIRPGQVYWNSKTGNRVVVYSVRPEITRVVVVTHRGYLTTCKSFTWKPGPPRDYVLQYDPPKRRV